MPNSRPVRFLVKDGVELPIRRQPIRFAVQHMNGLSSKSWNITTDRTGNAYVMCRDNYHELKASLHSSGDNRIAFTRESNDLMGDDSRIWNRWQCPRPEEDKKLVPLFRLLFPDWSLAIPYSQRIRAPSWRKVQCYAITGYDGLMTVVTFHLIGTRTMVRKGDGISFPIGLLPMGQDHRLLIVANRLPESNLRHVVEESMSSIDPSVFGMSSSEEDRRGDLLLTGYNGDGTGFMLSTPVEVEKTD